MKPISPDEVAQKKKESLPEEVIEATNELIAETWDGHQSIFRQDTLINRIINKWRGSYENISEIRQELFSKHHLDIEDIYRAEGWSVEYDKPGYSESYEANFTFKKQTKRP